MGREIPDLGRFNYLDGKDIELKPIKKERRFATKRQKIYAYLIADGKCAICGKELLSGFHVDHIIPFSKKGETELCNLQALCPKCNLTKGSN